MLAQETAKESLDTLLKPDSILILQFKFAEQLAKLGLLSKLKAHLYSCLAVLKMLLFSTQDRTYALIVSERSK